MNRHSYECYIYMGLAGVLHGKPVQIPRLPPLLMCMCMCMRVPPSRLLRCRRCSARGSPRRGWCFSVLRLARRTNDEGYNTYTHIIL